MCNKVNEISMQGVGVIAKKRCTKPVYMLGLCKYHYLKHTKKNMNWGDRPEYRPATQEDLDRGRSLKLKNSNVHKLYQLRKGEIKTYSSKEDKYVPTTLAPDFNLFCVLIY